MTQDLNRRSFLKGSGFAIAGLGTLSFTQLLAACGTDSGSSTGGGSEDGAETLSLRMPFLLDMQVPDPDIMYEGEGLQVMLGCYEGLIDYKPGTGDFVPQLAESWTVSADLLTYTFKLRPNVKFHDGTPADADAWVKSFKRRKDVDEGGAYMVAGVESATAADPTTFVVKLGTPNDAFLDYLACPWKPYAVSPTAVAKNATGDDLAKEWLKTHDAGTGPYVMSEFVPSSHYVLDAAPDYWGEKPQFKQVRMEIIPDVSTQRLKLESNELDLVTKGFAIEDVLAFQQNPEYTVLVEQATSIVALWINATGGMFTDKALRQAITHAIDREAVVKPTYQSLAKVQKNYYSENMFPDGKATFDISYDPSILRALVPSLPSKTVDLAYAESGGAPYRRMAELIQTQLSQTGLEVQVRGVPSSQIFAMAKGPADQRPDLLLWTYGGDALHVDTVLRIFLRTGAAPLNWAQYTNAEVDQEMDLALAEPTKDQVEAHYVKVAKTIQEEAWFVPFCRRPETIVAHKSISNIQLNSYYPAIFYAERLKSA